MPVLRVNVLGEFAIQVDGTPIVISHATRLQALLTHLLLHLNAPVSRQQAASTLWPDSSETQARTNLRKQLLLLRQLVPGIDLSLRDDGHTLALYARDTDSDLHEFLHAAARRDYQRAIALYKGELLPGCYDEWITPERERLSALFSATLAACADELEEQRNYRAALDHAARLARLDPLGENAIRRLMRLHALNGNKNEALRVYHSFEATLKTEVGAEPEEATRAMFAQLTASKAQPKHALAAPTAALVGRATEWRRLRDAWATALSGRPQLILITGEAGIGKTRLAEELLTWADRQGIVTAQARCYAAEGALAYAPIAAWLRTPAIAATMSALEAPWLTEVARILPEVAALRAGLQAPGPLTEGWQRQRLFEGLARAITGQGQMLTARVLLIDNAQWADRESIEWLHYLLRRDTHARLLVAATTRDDMQSDSHPLRALQLSLVREGRFVEVELAPLNSSETTQLAEQVAGRALAPGESAELYRETEGRPLFVVETMRVTPTNAEPASRLRGLPPTVQSVLNQRLEQLTPSARNLASQAACIGRAFSFAVLAAVHEDSADHVARNLDELLQRRIVRESMLDQATASMTYDFTHDKIRETAYARLSTAVRQRLHQRVARALEQLHASAPDGFWGQIAVHHDRAGDARAAIENYLRAAAVARSIYANDDAIRDYRRALTLLTGLRTAADKHEVARAGEALGDVLHHIGQDEEACGAYAVALSVTHDPLAAAELQLKVGNALRDRREYQPALRAYTAATTALGEPQPVDRSPRWWRVWIQVQLETLLVHYWLGQLDEGDALIAMLKPLLDVHGTPRQNAMFAQTASRASLRRNGFIATEETVAYARATAQAMRDAGEQTQLPSTEFGLGFALLWHGQPQEAVSIFSTVLNTAEQTGDISLVARSVSYLAVAHRVLVQAAEVEHYVNRGLVVAEAAHMPEYTALARANAAWIAWRSGDVTGARVHANEAVAIWRQFPPNHASTVVRWTAYFPLMAVAMHELTLEQAAIHARALLDPYQQRLPAALREALVRALAAHDAGEHAAAVLAFQAALARAVELHFM